SGGALNDHPGTGEGTAGSGGSSGVANCGSLAGSFIDGTAGTGDGTGGGAQGGWGGGSTWLELPQCATGPVTFGACFVSDADSPPPPANQDPGVSSTESVTVEAVGSGSAPAGCERARWI